jgi:hypothetical protein
VEEGLGRGRAEGAAVAHRWPGRLLGRREIPELRVRPAAAGLRWQDGAS